MSRVGVRNNARNRGEKEEGKGSEQDGLEVCVYAWYVCMSVCMYVCMCGCMLACLMCVAWLRGSIDSWLSPNCPTLISPTPSIPNFITPTCLVSLRLKVSLARATG